MKCSKCQAEVKSQAKTCPVCGSDELFETFGKTAASGTDVKITGKAPPSHKTGATTFVDSADTRTAMLTDTDKDVLAAGKMLADRYMLLDPIGSGGFAVVFKARDIKLGNRTVAVKFLIKSQQNPADRQVTVERFLRESTVIASLNHKNIVTVFDSHSEQDDHYIIMEFVEGGSLKDYLNKKGRLPPEEALKIVKGVCQGLACAHRKNLIHRDIKPSNIMLSFEGDEAIPKIVDFGLARSSEVSDVSISGVGMGTPFYVSPEQRRDAKNVNHTTDIYSTGKVLYELVTGELPDNVDMEKMRDMPGIADIVSKCIKTRPEERYFSATELIAAIEKYLSGKAGIAGKENFTGKVETDTSLIKCPSCSTVNPASAKFCSDCGSGLCRKCPECGIDLPMSISFCTGCGIDVAGFIKASEMLEKLEADSSLSQWESAMSALKEIPEDLKLSGERGASIMARINEIRSQASSKAEEAASYRKARASSEKYEGEGKFDKAALELENYVRNFPSGGHGHELKQKIFQLKKLAYKGPAPGQAWGVSGMDIELVPVQPGRFLMGSKAGLLPGLGGEKGRKSNEGPQHGVVITNQFWIGRFPITIGDYLQFMKSHDKDPLIMWTSRECSMDKAGKDSSVGNGCWADPRQPVIDVSWYAANAFCKWLTEREKLANCIPEGYLYRLPTEAEWEFACRAGSTARYSFGDNEKFLGEFAWFAANSENRTHPVGTKLPNAWGIHDMHGNVWEWCLDRFAKYSASEESDPLCAKADPLYVRRGGSWINDANHCRCAYRNCWEPLSVFPYLGFRIVLAKSLVKHLFA